MFSIVYKSSDRNIFSCSCNRNERCKTKLIWQTEKGSDLYPKLEYFPEQ